MKFFKKNNKIYIFLLWGFLFFPFFSVWGASGLDAVWSEYRTPAAKIYFPIYTEGLADLALFFVYLLVIIGGIFALIVIMVGALNMFLSSGNEDVHHSAKHAFVAGIISFILAIILYFSLDRVFFVVKELASQLA